MLGNNAAGCSVLPFLDDHQSYNMLDQILELGLAVLMSVEFEAMLAILARIMEAQRAKCQRSLIRSWNFGSSNLVQSRKRTASPWLAVLFSFWSSNSSLRRSIIDIP
mmetsp:Transcript_79598/g.213243  ORF Transcript_79598/g.213243 Transcript_79598/m.213243 type:complete len:107 (+) Transcript_79598:78-398(+)